MAASAKSGSEFIFGNLSAMLASIFGTGAGVPDPNTDAGPSGVYQWWALMDPRILYTKDQVTGYTGVVQSFLENARLESMGQIPAATSATNLAAAQAVVSGTAMTLAAANATGVTLAVPISPYAGVLNGAAVVTPAIALDFGFAFGTVVSGSTTVTVADSTQFTPGMPLVISGAGNAAGTIPLLTNVVTLASSTTITIFNSPLASVTNAAIGTGNIWGPRTNGFPTPTAAFPFTGAGPALVLDPRQALTRGLRIVGTASGNTGGTFLVSGYDIFGQAMSQLVTVAAGSSTGYTTKVFKYISSVVPQFTDTLLYSVGTSDVFGFAFRSRTWEDTAVFWNALPMVTATGWTGADTAAPTTTTNDVRGTIQTGLIGGGSGIGSTASNGTVSGLAMSGVRIKMSQYINVASMVQATQASAVSLFGQVQA